MKKLVLKLSLLALCVILISLSVDSVYRGMYQLEYRQPRDLWVKPPIEDKYKIVKVGNSHTADAITFEGYKLKSLPLSSVAQRFSYDLVMLKHYQNQIDDGAIIIIDATHLSFSHRVADDTDGLQYNYFGAVSPFLIPHLKVSDYLQSELVPFLRAGFAWRKAYTTTVNERIAQEEKWVEEKAPVVEDQPPAEEKPANAPTPKAGAAVVETSPETTVSIVRNDHFSVEQIEKEWASPSAAVADDYIDNMHFIYNKWYRTDEFDPKYFEANRKDLEKLIAYCLKQNWRPVIITSPVTKILEDGLNPDYKQVFLYDNLQKANLQGVEYLDFTNRTDITTNNALFSNADHFNKKGGALFSYVLLRELINRGYLPPEVDGYEYPKSL